MDSDLDKKRDALNRGIVKIYLTLDDDLNFIHSPGSQVKHLKPTDPERIRVEDQELDEFIQCAYGITFAKKIVTPGHTTPFKFVADLFFERVKNALGFANRNGGKTFAVAVLNHLDMLFKKKCEIASAGAILDQADKCYRYFSSFNELPWFKEFCVYYKKKSGEEFMSKSIQSWTEFGNGASLEVITGSEKGLRSPHPNKARIDEIDLMEWDTLQTGLSMAHTSNGNRGQNVFTSTRQNQQGSMQKLLDTAEAKGISVYQWNIWEALEKCTRRCINDPEHGTCPIYTFCKGKAHHCEGFYKIDDFIDKVRVIDREKFETEWINSKPAKHKYVYYAFDSKKHIMTPSMLAKMAGVEFPPSYWHRVNSIDFGSAPGHPFVYLKLTQLPTGPWLIFYEYVAEQKLLRDHANAIKRSPHYTRSDWNYADWDAQDRLELRELGIRTVAANKEVLMGIDLVQSLLKGFPPSEEPQLYVWYECVHTISEFGLYQWPTYPDGRVDKTGNPKKQDDHTMDALRYALYSSKKTPTRKYSSRKISGI